MKKLRHAEVCFARKGDLGAYLREKVFWKGPSAKTRGLNVIKLNFLRVE